MLRSPPSSPQTAGTQLCYDPPHLTPPPPIIPSSSAPVTQPCTPPVASILSNNERELPRSESYMLPPSQPCWHVSKTRILTAIYAIVI